MPASASSNRFLTEIGRGDTALMALLLASYPAMLAAAVVPSASAFIIAVVVGLAVDLYFMRGDRKVVVYLRQLRFGVSNRVMVRQLLLISLLARLSYTGQVDFQVVAVASISCVAFYGLQVLHGGIIAVVRKSRRMPISTRNIDLSALTISHAPPKALLNRAGDKVLHTDLPLIAGLLATSVTGVTRYSMMGAALTATIAGGYILVMCLWLRPSKWVPREERVLNWLDSWLREYAPTTVLYFSGSKESTYQLNMWLEPLERLHNERPLVIMRENHTFHGLQRTSLPILCVPSAVHLMNLDLADVRVAMYPAHVGKNLHLLRVPTMKHTFIGHGDSDKVASINPFGKAYDQLWTAGEAGRDRWKRADVGIRDGAIVAVGRPQLHGIDTSKPKSATATILYAPTWEGWTDGPGNTSLIEAGENIISNLLKADPPVRVVYKPHPFTGIRSKAAKAANARIITMLQSANFANGHGNSVGAMSLESAPKPGPSTQASLSRSDAAISRDDQTSDDELAIVRRAAADRNADFWISQPADMHLVVTGAEPTIYDCFNQTDALVSDVSSVVSDFIASGKPYAVVDSAGFGEVVFKRDNTAVRAAVILDEQGHGLDGLLAAVHDPNDDALLQARADLKSYILGPDEPTSQERFDRAVSELAEQADARNRNQESADAESVAL